MTASDVGVRQLEDIEPRLRSVSTTPRVSEPGRITNITVGELCDAIASDRWRASIEKIREVYSNTLASTGSVKSAADAIRAMKADMLPAICWAGIFTRRANDALAQHSGLMVVDFDHLGATMENSKAALTEDPHVLAVFVSPSGDGLKAIVRVAANDTDTHRRCFFAAEQYFRDKYHLEADPHCKDVSRACFVSYDPALVIRGTATPFEPIAEPEKKSTTTRPSAARSENTREPPDADIVASALRSINPNCNYDVWLEVAMALKSWNDSKGLDLFRAWSELAPSRTPKPGEPTLADKWASFTGTGITVATLFHHAKAAGWTPPSIDNTKTVFTGATATVGANIILPGNGVPITACAEAVFRKIGPSHRMFWRGGAVQELQADDHGGLYLSVLKPDAFRSRLESFGQVFKWAMLDGQAVLKPAIVSADTADALLLSTPAANHLPHIRGVANAPVFARGDGGQVLAQGYHPHMGGILILNGNPPPAVSTEDGVSDLLSLVSEFDFATPADLSRAIAAILTPALRLGGWIGGNIPMFTIEANESQAGKGYFLKLVYAVYAEHPYMVGQRNGGVGGMDESIQSGMMAGRPFIQLDNLRGRTDSAFLEMVLTAGGMVACRVPHRGDVPVDSEHFIFTATSNGVETTRDLANRCCIIRLRKKPGTFIFKRYSEGDLLAHVQAIQSRILGAVFSIVRAWEEAGCPRTAEHRHDFRAWTQSLDYIVREIMHLPPLMDGHGEAQARVANPALVWLRAVALAVETDKRLGETFSASSIAELCEDHGIEVPGCRGDVEDERRKRIGTLMKKSFGEHDVLELDVFTIARQESQRYDLAHKGFRQLKSYIFSRAAAAATTPITFRKSVVSSENTDTGGTGGSASDGPGGLSSRALLGVAQVSHDAKTAAGAGGSHRNPSPF